MAAQLILKNTGVTLQETFSAGAADGTVTVTSTKSDGSAGPGGSATHGTGGVYTFVVAPQAELEAFTFKWSGSWSGVAQSIESQVEIVGGLLFATAEARAFGDKILFDVTKYPDADIQDARDRITDLFQQVCSVSFIPRFARDTLDGSLTSSIDLLNRRPRRVISGSLEGTALTAGQIADIALYASGQASWISGAFWPWRRQSIVLSYEHGYASVPADVKRAALTLARYDLVSNDISDRMISFTNDLGSVRLSVPGYDYPTGIPIVDSTLNRYEECQVLA